MVRRSLIPDFSRYGRIVRFLLRLVVFTVAACLAVGFSVAVLALAVYVSRGLLDSMLASLFALVAFAAVIAVPTYLLVRRFDSEE